MTSEPSSPTTAAQNKVGFIRTVLVNVSSDMPGGVRREALVNGVLEEMLDCRWQVSQGTGEQRPPR